ncbi:MAG: alanine--tRNA ligase [Deltaproteobacteria bacterium]|nr:alanine--tRNA ligase [Deltaproteobacteria bacterium]
MREHRFVRSSPVVPNDDPTLLFANAGMNQFKDVFLGSGTRDYNRAANSQKCIRASGKHNDLEDVGRDNYHHTFFEMLGNWSFGDYFKEEGIRWAWELLTEVWGLDKTRLHATVFGGDEQDGLPPDEEAAELWRRCTDINQDNIHFFGKKENFWEMGDTGPCGPCSEIHIDMTEDRTGAPLVNADDARVIEIWNLVFIQFNRGNDSKLSPLPAKGVDTGMGLERVCRVLQGVDSNYSTDLFTPLLQSISENTGTQDAEGEIGVAYRVIADHLRSLSFAIADGAIPSNEGRGYVLRRMLRRATRFGRVLGMETPFIYKLVPTLAEVMGDAFPEIRKQQAHISKVIEAEEASFGNTLDRGLEIFEQMVAQPTTISQKKLSGEDAFKLYDTYGFPVDLTRLICEERQLELDEAGFEVSMDAQRTKARESARFQTSQIEWQELEVGPHSHFVGYSSYNAETWIRRFAQNELGKWLFTLDTTPFYAESGGQVADQGTIQQGQHTWSVVDVRKEGDLIIHVCEGSEQPKPEPVIARIDLDKRKATTRNHTGTHMLHAALKQIIGQHVNQAGSIVHPDYLRFDFTHSERLSSDQVEEIERLVNRKIRENIDLKVFETGYRQAVDSGVTALFGEKYGDTVRVVQLDDFSSELCGGCHTSATGEIGSFRIVSEGAIASGVRRIVAITGERAEEVSRDEGKAVQELKHLLNVQTENIGPQVANLMEEKKKLEKGLQLLKKQSAAGFAQDLISNARLVAGVPLLAMKVEATSMDELRSLGDSLRKELEGIALLGAKLDGKTTLLCVVADSILKRGAKAAEIVNRVAALADGRGGGKPHLAQAGIKSPEKLPHALAQAADQIENYLQNLN